MQALIKDSKVLYLMDCDRYDAIQQALENTGADTSVNCTLYSVLPGDNFIDGAFKRAGVAIPLKVDDVTALKSDVQNLNTVVDQLLIDALGGV